MQYRTLGNSGTIVTNYALGTMTFGAEATEETSHAILDSYFEAGGNFIDTADVYSAGVSEEIIGRWLAKRPEARDSAVVATKGRFPMGTAPNDVGTSRRRLTRGGWRNPAEQPRSTLQRVAYAVQDDKLVRLTWLSLDHAPNEQPNTQELLSGVSELRLRFLDSANAWQDRWPPTETPTTAVPPGGTAVPVPPLAIEWILVTERWGELRWLFRLPG